MKEMKIGRFLFLLIAAVVLSAFFAYFFYNYFIVENIIYLDMAAKVGDHFGLNADADAIRFGMVIPGTSGERSVLISNNAAYPLSVIILKSGDIAGWVDISENNFILKKNESRQIIFWLNAPKNSDFGNYTGKVQIIFKKVLFQ